MNDERSEHEPAAAESDPLPSGSLLPLFSTPFNWCDRRCERCPLAEECPLNRRERQRRWLHEARGEDPDSPAVALSDAEGELARALALAQAIAIEEGIDLDAPLPPLPVCLDEVRLRRAGLELTVALHAGLEADGSELTCALPAVVVDEAMRAGATLAAKCARIGGYLAERHEDIWTADAVPNLLLMERLGRQLDNALAAIEALPGAARLDAVRARRAELDRILEPLFASISPSLRGLLEENAARGAAPSPFSIVEPAAPDGSDSRFALFGRRIRRFSAVSRLSSSVRPSGRTCGRAREPTKIRRFGTPKKGET